MNVTLEELELLTLFRKLSKSDQAVALRVVEANEEAKAVGLNVRPHKNESAKETPYGQ